VIEDVVEAADRYIEFDNPHGPDGELSAEDQAYLETLLDNKSD
jgi:hypothetical protein